jgi:hypothetical protein
VLIALVALGGLLPAVMAAPAKPVLLDNPAAMPEPAQTALLTTPSMAAFLNDSWTPSPFIAPLASQVMSRQKNMTSNNTTANSTYAIYDFLNGDVTAPAATSPVFTASAAGKDRTVAWTGESIYQFLEENWTPSTPIETFPQSPFKMHQMN